MNIAKALPATILGLILSMAVVNAEAAMSSFVHGEDNANYIFLFADVESGGKTPLTFNNVTFSGGFASAGWALSQPVEPLVAIFTGSQIPAGTGTYNLDFNATKNNVSMQWTEVLYDGSSWSTLDNGTAKYNSTLGIWSGIGTPFSLENTEYVTKYFNALPPAPVPLPNSVILLLSALAYLGSRRVRGASEPSVNDVVPA